MNSSASIIIPTYNKLSRLRFTLESYRFQDTNDFEVVICDDGSTDGTAEMLASIEVPHRLRVIPGKHEGAGAARNRAVAASTGDILIFNDDDMVPTPQFVSAHIAACTRADILARGPRWSVPIDTVPEFLDRDVTELVYRAVWETARLTIAEEWTLHALEFDSTFPYRFLQTCTSNLAVRRDSFDLIGGFNESFGTGWGAEDTEFGYRAQHIGISVGLVPNAINLHLEHSTDSGRKFETGIENFRTFHSLYPDRRDVRALLSYVEHAVATGNATDLFDEQTFVDRPAPSIHYTKAKNMMYTDDVNRALKALRSGEMVLIVDDDDRENEGDLVAAAQFITPETINFMTLRGRGLICVALEAQYATRMGLAPMVAYNEDHLGTAFTVSVDGAPQFGVTTGISARDRATTIKVLIDPAHGPDALRRPGHMFPLIAHPEGVLGRRGHTEASTDLCEMAGLEKAAVIVEILRADGEMAREAELTKFAARHGIVKISVEDIVQAKRSEAWSGSEVAAAV